MHDENRPVPRGLFPTAQDAAEETTETRRKRPTKRGRRKGQKTRATDQRLAEKITALRTLQKEVDDMQRHLDARRLAIVGRVVLENMHERDVATGLHALLTGAKLSATDEADIAGLLVELAEIRERGYGI